MKKIFVAPIVCLTILATCYIHADVMESVKAHGQDILQKATEQTTESLTEKASEWASALGQRITDWIKGAGQQCIAQD